jgi:hypothetical protein
MMQILDDTPSDRETETISRSMRSGSISLVQSVEYMRQIVFGYPDSRVRDRHTIIRDIDRDLAVNRGEFASIGYDIAESCHPELRIYIMSE